MSRNPATTRVSPHPAGVETAPAGIPYGTLISHRPPRAAETSPAPAPDGKTELAWQAHWFAGDFGPAFTTTAGERVEIVQLGVWNHEPGPDFREAAVAFPDRPGGPVILRGAVEMDLVAEDWEQHGHADNPAFDGVVLHVFFDRRDPGREFWTRTSAHGNVAQVRLDPRALEDRPTPTGGLAARPGRCSAPLRELPASRVGELLAAAARHRLGRKAARFARLAAAHGEDEALWTTLAAALGYKENQLPFTLLAQRLPLRTLRAEGPAATAALLFGLSGFLTRPAPPEFAEGPDACEARLLLRGLWDGWWTRREAFARLALPPGAWTLAGQRPANHPQRRVAALAAMARHWPRVRTLAASPDPARDVPRVLRELSDPFWDHRYTLLSARSPRPLALIGDSRATEMLANVFFPRALAADPTLWESYARLPAKLTNRRVETAAVRLFGADEDRRRAFTRTVAHQQGLLQVYEDFCLRDASDCARCSLPERLRTADFAG